MITTWANVSDNSDFTIYNIPFGVAKIDKEHYVVSRIGDEIIVLEKLLENGLINGVDSKVLKNTHLNDFIALGKNITKKIRETIIELLSDETKKESVSSSFVDFAEVEMTIPVKIQDYTDFYSSIEHATNVGKMFRDPSNALLPNWKHLPVGYHGRASSIVVSGTDIKRPNGQTRPDPEKPPVFGPSKRLDFELEMGFIVGKSTKLGESLSTAEAQDHIFGVCLFNDWSARDIQKWEYVPLGPFLGKSFASTMSAWIVTLEALEPFRLAGPKQDPEVLDYLKYEGDHNYDIELYVDYITKNGKKQVISHSNFKFMYWNMLQQLTHHTINGCNINVGDLYASGTISGKDEKSYGSLLEITWSGKNELDIDGDKRKFIENGDTIALRGKCQKGDVRLGFGECIGKVI